MVPADLETLTHVTGSVTAETPFPAARKELRSARLQLALQTVEETTAAIVSCQLSREITTEHFYHTNGGVKICRNSVEHCR